MQKLKKTKGVVSTAAAMAGMHRQTAAKYLKAGMGPTEMAARAPKRGRRRPDPLVPIWDRAVAMLAKSPELEAVALFNYLCAQQPGVVSASTVRTFQRRVKEWRELNGPPKELYFQQVRKPAEMAQFDWTRVKPKDFAITINGVPFEHLLTHLVLPYSNWEWAVPCLSESALSLKRGVQEGFWRLGGITPVLQTDCSSTATHQIERGSKARTFNSDYLAFCEYLKIEPRTTHVRSPDENGDVESAQGHLKRRLRNQLLLRGSSDFKSEADYAAFVAEVCESANTLRVARLHEEVQLLKKLPARRYPEIQEVTTRVTGTGVISVNKIPYTVPSRLVGVMVSVQVGERDLSIFHGSKLVLVRPKATAEKDGIDYRDIIDTMIKKPGAFARFLYRESLFPTICFRQGYEALKAHEEVRADKRYLQLLYMAAKGSETEVSDAIGDCLREDKVPLPELVKKLIDRKANRPMPAMQLEPLLPSLHRYDALLSGLVRA